MNQKTATEAATDPAQAKARVNALLGELRDALSDYRRLAKEPPLFVLEKQAPALRPGALENARIYADRHAMIRALVSGGIGGEVGVQAGHFSRFLLDKIAPDHLHLFDMSDQWLRADVRSAPNITLHLGDSSKQLGRLPDQSFDWLYIDGDHSYDGVRRDAMAALKKIKPGGTLIFNDYVMWSPGEAIPYGVMACVNELVADGLDMAGVALTRSGYFDVALKAPA